MNLNLFHVRQPGDVYPLFDCLALHGLRSMVMWQPDGEAKSATKVCANAEPHEGQTSDQQAPNWLEEMQCDDYYDVFICSRT